MPTPEKINTACNRLPIVELNGWEKPRGDKVWEANEKGGHFHFFNHTEFLYSLENKKGRSVSISGSEKSRFDLAQDFINVLGKPACESENYKKTYLTWWLK
jgi:hypothetical protein